MTLTALLVCVDEAEAAILRQVLKELSIRVEECPDLARAAIRLAQDRFDVVIVDGESNSEVVNLLRESRLSRLNEATLAVAIVSGQDSIRELFSLGVNFALYKPVAYDRALSSMRAARALMRKEKRKNARAAVHTHATVDYANVESERGTLIDLAQDGMQILFGKKLPPTSKVYFQFVLPGQKMPVRLSGQVVWQDWNGRAGVQFMDVPKASRKVINEFLDANLPKHVGPDQLADVAVEMDDHVVEHVSIPLETPGSKKSHSTAKAAPAAAVAKTKDSVHAAQSGELENCRHGERTVAHEEVNTDNRRTQERYACRISAEVYRTGTSVPNYCCLTDLSSGGCYLEVPLPFPSGCSVEIVVRTYELKLRLRGLVQASHPGYGMGVAFELKTKEENENMKKLLEFVAATTEPSK
ncbi:MAG TPA: response regulator [Verrucomicrobiae bacterium]|jgi:hypothetical protein|nr:response regulator [Verrucomicrobiae bacterium]